MIKTYLCQQQAIYTVGSLSRENSCFQWKIQFNCDISVTMCTLRYKYCLKCLTSHPNFLLHAVKIIIKVSKIILWYKTINIIFSATKTCEDKFAMAGDSVDFSCPIPGAGPISWFFRKTTDTNWTSFPFSFCKCSFCDYELCVLKRGILEIRDASITNKGFFECERNGAHHCFDLALYSTYTAFFLFFLNRVGCTCRVDLKH